jgi:aconitate hydratase
VEALGLSGRERFTIRGLDHGSSPVGQVSVEAVGDAGRIAEFPVTARIDGQAEAEYYQSGGVLPMLLRRLLPKPGSPA